MLKSPEEQHQRENHHKVAIIEIHLQLTEQHAATHRQKIPPLHTNEK